MNLWISVLLFGTVKSLSARHLSRNCFILCAVKRSFLLPYSGIFLFSCWGPPIFTAQTYDTLDYVFCEPLKRGQGIFQPKRHIKGRSHPLFWFARILNTGQCLGADSSPWLSCHSVFCNRHKICPFSFFYHQEVGCPLESRWSDDSYF